MSLKRLGDGTDGMKRAGGDAYSHGPFSATHTPGTPLGPGHEERRYITSGFWLHQPPALHADVLVKVHGLIGADALERLDATRSVRPVRGPFYAAFPHAWGLVRLIVPGGVRNMLVNSNEAITALAELGLVPADPTHLARLIQYLTAKTEWRPQLDEAPLAGNEIVAAHPCVLKDKRLLCVKADVADLDGGLKLATEVLHDGSSCWIADTTLFLGVPRSASA